MECFTTKLWLGWEKEYVNRNKMDWDRLGKSGVIKRIVGPVSSSPYFYH